MVVFTGSTVEEAIQKGLKELDILRLKAHIKVISREKNGFLGLFGKKPAQVALKPLAKQLSLKQINKLLRVFLKKSMNKMNQLKQSVKRPLIWGML